MMLTLNTVTPAFRSVSNNLPKYRTKAMTANISTHHFTADQNKEGKLVMWEHAGKVMRYIDPYTCTGSGCTMNHALWAGLSGRAQVPLWRHLGVYFCQFHPKGSQKWGVETFFPFPELPCSPSSWLQGLQQQTDWSRDKSDIAPREAI